MGVVLDTKCPVCLRLNEDGGHIFLKCKRVKECWNSLGIGAARERLLECATAHDMLHELWKLEDAVQLKSIILMWEWWSDRNKANAGKGVRSITGWRDTSVDFLSLNVAEKPPKPPDIQVWSKPPNNFLKVNFDGAFDSENGSGGWGYIIWDHEGTFVAAGAGKSIHLRDSLHAEAVACLTVVEGATRLGAKYVILESDASNLVKALNSCEYDSSTIGVLVKEAKTSCSLYFDQCVFSFSRRACNSAAYELAKFGVRSGFADYFWVDSAPSFVTDIVTGESAVLVE